MYLLAITLYLKLFKTETADRLKLHRYTKIIILYEIYHIISINY